ncbi:DUF2336 domain-containing protein [Siculibacillus lacustris]|nr:DUF2336 domain-containing protein [Siculibacillus lacustris]
MALDPMHLDLLARDASPSGRGRLLSDLSRLMLVDRQADPTELEIFFDIVRAILAGTAVNDRRVFSETAADHAAVPRDLVLILAEDEIRVAEPVLTRSALLTDDDLMALTERKNDDHRLAIAARTRLSQAVCAALVRLGSVAVLHRVGGNDGADLADETIRELQAHAERDPELQRILGERPDLPELLARCMRNTLRRIASRPQPETAEVPAAKPAAPPAVERSATVRPLRSPAADERPEVVRLLERVTAGELTASAVVADLAAADRHAELASFLGSFADLDETQVMRVLVRADSVGIATVARGLDIDETAYAAIVELRQRRLKFSAAQSRWEREHFERLDAVEARATINQHGSRRARA